MDYTAIKNQIENYFHIGFDLREVDSIVFFSPTKSYGRSFNIIVENRSNIRYILKAEPQDYAADFLLSLSKSSLQKRINCGLISNEASIAINNHVISVEEFVKFDGNWDSFQITYEIISQPFNEESIFEGAKILISMMLSLIDYSIEGAEEGDEIEIVSKRYERNPINRQLCLDANGYKCAVCGFDFEKVYGDIGKNVIEVHHIIPVHTMGPGYVVDPIKEMIPLCSNCHTIVHKKNPPYTIEEIKTALSNNKDNN